MRRYGSWRAVRVARPGRTRFPLHKRRRGSDPYRRPRLVRDCGVEAAIKAGWVGATDWVLDTEPTDAQIQVAHKGRTWFELTMQGVTAHASQPWKGADAIAAMAEAICRIRAAIEAQPEHAELGRSTVTFGQIEGGYRPNVVPDRSKV